MYIKIILVDFLHINIHVFCSAPTPHSIYSIYGPDYGYDSRFPAAYHFLAYHTMPHSLAIHRPPLRIEHLGHFGIIHWDFIVFDLGFPMGNKESRIINQAPPNSPAAHLAVISRTSSVLPRLRCFCMKLYPDKPIRHVRITNLLLYFPSKQGAFRASQHVAPGLTPTRRTLCGNTLVTSSYKLLCPIHPTY